VLTLLLWSAHALLRLAPSAARAGGRGGATSRGAFWKRFRLIRAD
jgi:hypothetical protein